MLGRASAVALACAALGCGAGAPAPLPAPAERPSAAPEPPRARARYLILGSTWIERTGEGLDRVVAGGRRMELDGLEPVSLGPAEPEVEGGARAPAWTPPGPSRYVFWRGKQLYAAETFAGALRPLAALPGGVRGAFEWIDGVGLVLAGGAVVVPAAGGPPGRLGVTAAASALAADARRALAVTAFGHALLTLDGGASYRDVSADLGGVVRLAARGDAIEATLSDGRERFVTASGSIVDAVAPGPARARPPADDADRFPGLSEEIAVRAAAAEGLPLPDGGVVIVARGFVGRLDLAARRTTSLSLLDPGARQADCVPFRAGDGVVLACAGPDHASFIDLDGAPRTERTFDLSGARALDRFAGADGEAIGYLGPCEGGAPQKEPVQRVSSGEPYNASTQRSPVFCVRARRDTWVEHRLDPAEASDVIAWIPRPGGGAAALLARPGSFLDERDRVSVRGALRVVRVARNEPPLSIPTWAHRQATTLDRSLRIGADDAIEGWLPSSSSVAIAVTIDAAGHVHRHEAPPGASAIAASGRFALTSTEGGKLYETTDGGHRWARVEPPPGVDRVARPSRCSPAGCALGSVVRLGWSGPADDARAAPATDDALLAGRAQARRRAQQRDLPVPPLLRLACSFDGPPEGRRVADSGGFGFTPTAQPRSGSPARIGTLGVVSMPHNGSRLPTAGDAELAWIPPLDPAAPIRRTTVPLGRLGIAPGAYRPYELKVGYLLDAAASATLGVFPVGPADRCFATLLEAARIARPIGGCAGDPSVGVELGGRVIVLHASYQGLLVSAANAGPRRGSLFLPAALRELGRTPLPFRADGFAFGVGARDGAPVAVVVDARGEASLAPIDPERGTLGPEERLGPLPRAALGSDRACAPRPGEARVVLPFDGAIGLDRASLRGVAESSGPGVAVLRWSPERACLDAVEIPVRDERFDESPAPYVPHGVVRKLVARFDGRGKAGGTLVLIANGSELRQRVVCTGLAPGREGAP
jgi:hypothetical protein